MSSIDFETDSYPEEAFRCWEAERLDYEQPFSEMLASQVQKATAFVERPVVVDAACGEGYAKQLLENRLPGVQIIGVDFDRESLSDDRWLPAEETTPRCVASLDDLPFRSSVVDAVISISGLNTLDSVMQPALEETARILKLGGSLIATNDTARGAGIIMTQVPGEGYGKKTPVITYDAWGEIAELAMVDVKAMEQALVSVGSSHGVPGIGLDNYMELILDREQERMYAPLYAEAAQLVLHSGEGHLPFQEYGSESSYNRFFTNTFTNVAKQYFKLSIQNDRRSTAIAPVELPNLQGDIVYAHRQTRDSIGNVYYTDLSSEKPTHTIFDVKAQFVVGTKLQEIDRSLPSIDLGHNLRIGSWQTS